MLLNYVLIDQSQTLVNPSHNIYQDYKVKDMDVKLSCVFVRDANFFIVMMTGF